MGRVFLSPRLGIRTTAERWRRLAQVSRGRATLHWQAGMAMAHVSEAFLSLDKSFDAAFISVFTEIVRCSQRS